MTVEILKEGEAKGESHRIRGIAYALTTMALWGTLPIFLKIALRDFSSGTIVWFRFAFAFVFLFVFLALRKSRPLDILRNPPGSGILAGICLAANYYAFMEGIRYSGPSNTAILIQTAPLMAVLLGVFVFKEKLDGRQIFGIVLAAAGFFLFYMDQRKTAADAKMYLAANTHILFAAGIWAVYVALQKQLSRRFDAQRINLLVYGCASLVLPVGVDWGQFVGVSFDGWLLLVLLGVNTVLAYGALAEAIVYIPLTHVSVIITLNPLITLFSMRMINEFRPAWIAPEPIGGEGYLGALGAIAGVVLVLVKK